MKIRKIIHRIYRRAGMLFLKFLVKLFNLDKKRLKNEVLKQWEKEKGRREGE